MDLRLFRVMGRTGWERLKQNKGKIALEFVSASFLKHESSKMFGWLGSPSLRLQRGSGWLL